LYLSLKPYVGVPAALAPIPPHQGFPLYYPVLIGHMVGGTLAMTTMCLQVWPWLRMNHPRWHRISGRLYVIGVLMAAAAGWAVVWYAFPGGKVGALAILVIWPIVTVVAYVAVRRKNFLMHRRFMLYSFAFSANNMWATFALLAINHWHIPIDLTYLGEAFRWIPWVGDLMLVQWFLYRTERRPGWVLRRPKPAAVAELEDQPKAA
jgi:uncharacterized membrane protein